MEYYGYGPYYEAGIREEDVAEVVHEWSDSPEGYGSEDVMLVVRLTDGRFAYFEAWCDTTGWDCRAGASAVAYADTLKELVPEMSVEARRVFGYEATPDCGV